MSNEHRIKSIALPTLSFKDREIAYIKILAKAVTPDADQKEESGKGNATVMKVIDLQTGEEVRLICPSVLTGILHEEGENYVGKCYEVYASSQVKPGKRYKEVEVYEVACDTDYSQFPIKRFNEE